MDMQHLYRARVPWMMLIQIEKMVPAPHWLHGQSCRRHEYPESFWWTLSRHLGLPWAWTTSGSSPCSLGDRNRRALGSKWERRALPLSPIDTHSSAAPGLQRSQQFCSCHLFALYVGSRCGAWSWRTSLHPAHGGFDHPTPVSRSPGFEDSKAPQGYSCYSEYRYQLAKFHVRMVRCSTAVGSFIPITGHPNGDAVSTQHRSSLGKVVRADKEIWECKCSLALAVLLGTSWSHRIPSLPAAQRSRHSADIVQAMRREVDGAAGGVVQRQHEQEQNWYLPVSGLT